MTDKRKRRLTDAEKAEIIDLVQSGIPSKEVASTYNVHLSTVYRMVIKANHLANPPVPPPQMPGETKQQYGGRVYQWKILNDPVFRAQMKRAHRGRRRRRSKPVQLELPKSVSVGMPVEIQTPPPPPPTWWQRALSWVWPI